MSIQRGTLTVLYAQGLGETYQDGNICYVMWACNHRILERFEGFCARNNIVNLIAIHDEADFSKTHLVDPEGVRDRAPFPMVPSRRDPAKHVFDPDALLGRVANQQEAAYLRLSGIPICGVGSRLFAHVNVSDWCSHAAVSPWSTQIAVGNQWFILGSACRD